MAILAGQDVRHSHRPSESQAAAYSSSPDPGSTALLTESSGIPIHHRL